MYLAIKNHNQEVMWRKLFFGNSVKPRSLCTLWLSCHGRLATKDRLDMFGLLDEDCCYFCREKEIIHHL